MTEVEAFILTRKSLTGEISIEEGKLVVKNIKISGKEVIVPEAHEGETKYEKKVRFRTEADLENYQRILLNEYAIRLEKEETKKED